MKEVKHPCISCVYYSACGSTGRTEPCKGRKTKSGRNNKYLGYHDKEPYCDAFACYRDGEWYWLDDYDRPIAVEVTAWRYNCEPYKVV